MADTGEQPTPGELLTPTEEMILKYAGAREQISRLVDATNSGNFRNVVAVLQGLEREVSKFGASVNSGEDARYIANIALGTHSDRYKQTEQIAQNNNQTKAHLAGLGATVTNEQWGIFVQQTLDDIDRMTELYGIISQDLTQWTAGRIALSTADKALRKLHGTSLAGSGIRELVDYSRALATARRVADREQKDLMSVMMNIIGLISSYRKASALAGDAHPMEIDPDPGILRYLRNGLEEGSTGTPLTAYDIGKGPTTPE